MRSNGGQYCDELHSRFGSLNKLHGEHKRGVRLDFVDICLDPLNTRCIFDRKRKPTISNR